MFCMQIRNRFNVKASLFYHFSTFLSCVEFLKVYVFVRLDVMGRDLGWFLHLLLLKDEGLCVQDCVCCLFL